MLVRVQQFCRDRPVAGQVTHVRTAGGAWATDGRESLVETMSINEREPKDADGIADETTEVTVPGGTLVYRVERERSELTGDRIVGQTLVDIAVEDADRLRPVLNHLGHESAHVTHGGVKR